MTVNIEDLKILGNKILVKNMEFGVSKTAGGIIKLDDDMKLHGARPRWAQVLAVGPEITDVKVGQYIALAHGAWTRGFSMLENNNKVTARMIDNKEILLVADEPTQEYSQSEKL
jgi:hypothetical protein